MSTSRPLSASQCGRTRRSFLADCGFGFTGLAMGAMLARDGIALGNEATWVPPDGNPHFQPRAKSVIWIFMLGGVSHMESFDPKPALTKHAGKTIAESPYGDAVLKSPYYRRNVQEFVAGRKLMASLYPLQVGYRKRGQSGVEIADWWPHIGGHVDDLAIVRSCWCTDNDHGAQYEFNTGHHLFDGYHPSIGSWVHWGLGSLNDNLPSFVVLGEGPDVCCGGNGAHSASYLGPMHTAVQLDVDPTNPLPYASPGVDVFEEEQAAEIGLLQALNRQSLERYPRDAAVRARIQSYELAFRMQRSVPELMRLSTETPATHKLYGLDNPVTQPFGNLCLAARRMVERGVRFVQVYHGAGAAGGWDAHSDLKGNHGKLAPQVDQPIAALLTDLKQRGLFDETIVVFASEFGRTPGSEQSTGRDHHPYGFSVWLAGGGLKRGVVHGATDEIGFHAVENRHYVTNIHATVLKQLGLDHKRMEIPGRKRLEIKLGKPIDDIIA